MRWDETSPDTPLSQLTAGDLLEAIGWALTNYKVGQEGGQGTDVKGFTFERGKLTLPVITNPGAEVMGWKVAERWGQWNSNFWGISPAVR